MAGSCKIDADCSSSFVCEPATSSCVPGGGCGSDEFAIDVVQPNVMRVVDRSGSMGDADFLGTNMTRWEVAVQAIESVSLAYADRIRFGLALFSACEPGGCSAGTIVLPIPSTPSEINQTASVTILCPGNDPETSIGATLEALIGEQARQCGAAPDRRGRQLRRGGARRRQPRWRARRSRWPPSCWGSRVTWMRTS